ncbi:metallophosphoesterase [Melioribacter sp. OK-6-Me]|uniref:metallophosphoesterase n=1 Tax=unclassified Melioribacter TaxID=2627329 RepID=UPI003ED9542E
MKLTQMILFFGIVFAVYGLINYYIVKRLLSVIPEQYKGIALILSLFFVLSYIIGRVIENYWISYLSDFLVWIGSFWIAIMFYTFLSLLIIDLIRLINWAVPFLPGVLSKNPIKTKQYVAMIVSIFVVIMVVGGFITTRMIQIRKYNLIINKKAGDLKSLNIVMVSDLHLGTINGSKFAYKIVDKINKLKPDIILFAGDIIDEDIEPVLRDNVGNALLELRAKYGVYGITGNHEYIGGVNKAVDYLNNHNIKIIRDGHVLIDNSFYVVGREDRAINRFSEYNRKSLQEIMADIDKSMPVIMMDHQPFNLEEAQNNGVDLQLSGHTHNGQLWPLNYIVKKIYELPWGYKTKGSTHYYVSCGVGGWGPPVRTGSLPEIIQIKLNFTGK